MILRRSFLLVLPVLGPLATAWDEDLLAALELEEDCSMGGCDGAINLLQTKSAYRSQLIDPVSFLQMEEEVGVVHGAASAKATTATAATAAVASGTAAAVGEVHMDSKQLRQWQEEAIEVYSEASEARHASATWSESRAVLKEMQSFVTASGLWLALAFALAAALLLLYLQNAKPPNVDRTPSKEDDFVAASNTSSKEAPASTDDDRLPPQQLIPQPAAPPEMAEPPRGERSEELRRWLQEVDVCCAQRLPSMLPSPGLAYDCALARPASSGKPVKFLARIEGPLPGGPPPLGLLRAPLSQRNCVYFSAEAQGETAKKVVEGLDFQVSMIGAPSVLIDVYGHDLTLLDAYEHNWTPSQSLGSLPPPWRDFLDAGAQSSACCFRFREDLLLVGSEVVLAGELLRDSRGRIFLQPWDWTASAQVERQSWQTSWEAKLEPSILASNDTSLAKTMPALPALSATSIFDSNGDLPPAFLML